MRYFYHTIYICQLKYIMFCYYMLNFRSNIALNEGLICNIPLIIIFEINIDYFSKLVKCCMDLKY